MARYKQIKVPELAHGPVSVRYDTEWEEYQVRIKGQPKATYHTSDRADALSTAQVMRNTLAQKGEATPPKGAFSVADAGRFSWESRDCAVRAVSLAMGMPYAEAHAKLKAAGRKDRQGTYAHTITKATGLTWESAKGRTRPTYAQWLKDHLQGVYIVFVTGHFFAVVNGLQLDMGPSLYRPRSRVWGHWRVA